MRALKTSLALLVLASPLFAGTTYKFENKTEGIMATTMAGVAELDGPKMRMEMASGDNIIFKNGTIVISTDGGKTLNVLDPKSRTYFILNPEDLTNSLGALSMLQLTNPTAKVADAGDGGTIESYPTQKSAVDVGFDLAVGEGASAMHVALHTDLWTTDKLGADKASFLQTKGFHTGLPAVDKIIDAQAAAVRGRFPLKSVTTMSVKGGAMDISAKTTSTVSGIKTKDIPSSDFVIPSDYAKGDNPLDAMKKLSGQ